jgi:hypothetical protein
MGARCEHLVGPGSWSQGGLVWEKRERATNDEINPRRNQNQNAIGELPPLAQRCMLVREALAHRLADDDRLHTLLLICS